MGHQTAGFSPTPQAFKDKPYMRNFYGEGVHVISYPASPDTTSWAMTLSEQAGAEADWGLISAAEMDQRKSKLMAKVESWKDPVAQELIQTATRMLKFGLFDRDEVRPDQWHTRRCVLVGDVSTQSSQSVPSRLISNFRQLTLPARISDKAQTKHCKSFLTSSSPDC
jgi:salicylate hydroxylase